MIYLKFTVYETFTDFIHETTSRYSEYKYTENEYKDLFTPDFGSKCYQNCKTYSVNLENEIIREYMPKHFSFIRYACKITNEQIQQ